VEHRQLLQRMERTHWCAIGFGRRRAACPSYLGQPIDEYLLITCEAQLPVVGESIKNCNGETSRFGPIKLSERHGDVRDGGLAPEEFSGAGRDKWA
jgi:hypothetical protein